jgi:leucine dehydrogenase
MTIIDAKPTTLEIKEIPVEGYEKVIEAVDEVSGLHAIIAVHNTNLGPALGGTRFMSYPTREEALDDVLRLSRGMTYKSAILEIGRGGGKSVIIGDPKTQKTEALFRSFAQALNALGGLYICAEDMGTTPEDMAFIARYTDHVLATSSPESSGDPSPFTAWGVFRSIQAVCKHLWGDGSVEGRTVAIQGLGSVGEKLMDTLFWNQAKLVVCDIDPEKAKALGCKYGAKVVPCEEIYKADCDIFAPCAIGGILNDSTIPLLKCRAVVGAANNQLLRPEHGDQLAEKGILYAPDYVVNTGGIMNISVETHEDGYNPAKACSLVNMVYANLLRVIAISEERRIPTYLAAEELAEQKFCR